MIEQLTDWQNALTVAAVLVALYLLIMWAAAVVWTYRDSRARTTDPLEQASSVLLVAIFNIPGLLLHVLMRPKTTIEDQMDRRLEAEAMFQDIQERPACPQCAAPIQPDFIMCPLCRAQLRTPCGDCRQPLAVDWAMCPYCTAERTPAPTAARWQRAPRAPVASGATPRPAFALGRPRG